MIGSLVLALAAIFFSEEFRIPGLYRPRLQGDRRFLLLVAALPHLLNVVELVLDSGAALTVHVPLFEADRADKVLSAPPTPIVL